MRFEQFARQQKAKPKPVYVIFGSDQFLVQRARQMVRKMVIADADPQVAEVEFDGSQCSFGDVIEELQTLPFLGPRRLVWVQNAGIFIRDHRDALSKYLDSLSATGVLGLILEEFKTDTKLAKKVAAVGHLVECKPPYPDQMAGWITSRLRASYKKPIDHAAAQMLAEHVGNDLALADEELKKLVLYVGERERIDEADVAVLVTHAAPDQVWALGDAIAGKNPALAITILNEFLAEGMVAPQIIGALRSQFSRLLKGKALAQRMPLGDVASRLRVSYPFSQRFIQQIQGSSMADLVAGYRELAEADFASKTSSGSDRDILERLILILCSRSGDN